jgi:MoxR-like ATPase
MKHNRYDEVINLVENDIPILLIGEAGSGKTTLIKQIAEQLNLKFFSVSMTRQTTLSSLVGFKNINGDYVSSQLREAVEFGGLMLLDEIDAGDPNVLLCINTLENNFMSFPDIIVKKHKDFRLCATANPQGKQFTGRAVLDAATLDRFDIIDLPTDKSLETEIIGASVADQVKDIRETLKKWNYEKSITMRDSIRLKKRIELNLVTGFIEKLFENNDELIADFNERRERKTFIPQEMCNTIDELILNVKKSQGVHDA